MWSSIILAGLLFALDLYVWHRAVVYAGAGLGTILGNTQVFYTSIFGFLFLGEKLSLRYWISVSLAFVGITLLVRFQQILPSTEYTEGVFFGLLTGIVYAAYLLCLRKSEGFHKLKSTQLLGLVSLVTALCLLGVSGMEQSLRLPNGMEWIWLIGLALVAQIAGWWLTTHLNFYSDETIRWIAGNFGWTSHHISPSVWLLQKSK